MTVRGFVGLMKMNLLAKTAPVCLLLLINQVVLGQFATGQTVLTRYEIATIQLVDNVKVASRDTSIEQYYFACHF